MRLSYPKFWQALKPRNQRLGLTLLEMMMTVAISSVTILALASIITVVTTENEKTRGQSEILTDFALSNEVLSQLLSQTTRIQTCNCNNNCLLCSDAGGCTEFTTPAQWVNATPPNPPNPFGGSGLPNGGNCGNVADSPAAQIETRLSLPAGTLGGNCLLLVEFEDLASHPKRPANNFVNPVFPAPQPNSIWQTEPDPSIFTGARTARGSCNDYGQTAASSSQTAAGCWRDLYVYYVRPVLEDATAGTESRPGYIVFAITTSPSRNGGVNFPGNRPLVISTIGTGPGQSMSAVSASGVAGVACGYVAGLRRPIASVPGAGDSFNGRVAIASGYNNNPPNFARSLEFGFFILAKSRYFNNPINAGAATYESWHPAGSNFKIGKFRNLFTRVNFHNLTERGIHFLKLSSTKMGVDPVDAGHAKSFGCFENSTTPPNGSRRYCCSGALSAAGLCAGCIPSGFAADGDNSCCSEQLPAANGRCP